MHVVKCTSVTSKNEYWHRTNVFLTYIKFRDNYSKSRLMDVVHQLDRKSAIDHTCLKVNLIHNHTYSVTWVDKIRLLLPIVIWCLSIFLSYHEHVRCDALSMDTLILFWIDHDRIT